MSSKNRGIWLALVTALVSGVAVFVNKFAVGIITPPLVFTATKNFGVGLFILGLLLVSGKWKKIGSLKSGELGRLGLIGIIGGTIPFYLFFTGLSQIPAINGAIIHKTLVLWVALLAIPFLKERLSLVQISAIAVMVWANLGIGGFKGFEMSVGELMVLGATLLWAVENVIAKKVLENVDADLVVGARMGFGSLVLMGAAVWQYPEKVLGVFSLSGNQWMWMLFTAVTLLAYVMSWYRALKLAPATLVATVLVSATLVTNVLSAVFVTKAWNWELLWQAVMMLGAVGVYVREILKVSAQGEKVVL